MDQRLDIGLNSKINEFSKKFNIERNENNTETVFEYFSNYVIGSNLLEEELENINSISTGQSQGIDGIVIIVNNRLIADETDLAKIGVNEKLKIEIGFIQATIQKSFDLKKFQAYIDMIVSFLSGHKIIEPFSTIFNKLFNEEGDYIDRLEDTPRIIVYFVSGKTNHQLTETDLDIEKKKITQRAELEGKLILKGIYILQTEETKSEYDKIAKFHSTQLKFDKNVQLEEKNNIEFSLLATIKFSELKKLILTNDKKLRERLFVENVRNFIGTTDVNSDIKTTLDNENFKEYFAYLNNGLTIMCDLIEKHKIKQNEFILTYPRIINGCQTTHILFEKFKEDPHSIEDVEIVVKVISTKDNELKKKIIFAANNQNSIQKDLQSLNEFHEKIEQYFSGVEGMPLYFERLRGQHSQVNPPYSRINIENLAKIYISVFKKEPHKMKSNAIQKIEEYQKSKTVFNENDNIADYYYCAILYYWLNYFTINNLIELKSKTADMHLLMACNLQLEKLGYDSTDKKISYLNKSENALSVFTETNKILNNQNFLFDRRGFYSAPKTRDLLKQFKTN
jgi:hypothetical protein